jgi:hypothetical protein
MRVPEAIPIDASTLKKESKSVIDPAKVEEVGLATF